MKTFCQSAFAASKEANIIYIKLKSIPQVHDIPNGCCHRRRLLILAGGAETRNEKPLHTNFSKLSVIRTQFGSLINDVLYPIH